jgi:hypothetical protein
MFSNPLQLKYRLLCYTDRVKCYLSYQTCEFRQITRKVVLRSDGGGALFNKTRGPRVAYRCCENHTET